MLLLTPRARGHAKNGNKCLRNFKSISKQIRHLAATIKTKSCPTPDLALLVHGHTHSRIIYFSDILFPGFVSFSDDFDRFRPILTVFETPASNHPPVRIFFLQLPQSPRSLPPPPAFFFGRGGGQQPLLSQLCP